MIAWEKKRIYELAKEMNKASKDVVDKAHQLGMDVKTIWAQLVPSKKQSFVKHSEEEVP